MIIKPIKTERITHNSYTLYDIVDKYVPALEEKSIVVITSKIVSLCEDAVIPTNQISKEELIEQQSSRYLPPDDSPYSIRFTITKNLLIPTAGIDESNGQDVYILWPKNPQKSANDIRDYLTKKFKLSKVGVIITDSTCMPMRRGTSGIFISHSGFLAINNYIGKNDLFGNPLKVTVSNIAGGLAAGAVAIMGEGSEQTPIVIISDLPQVTFQSRNPSQEEIDMITIEPEDDLFAPFLMNVKWQMGEGK